MSLILSVFTNSIVLGIATLLGVILTIIFYFTPLARKKLIYGIVSSTAIVALDTNEGLTTSLGKNLEIRYGGDIIANLYVTMIKIRNVGDIDIYIPQRTNQTPIKFTFDQKILAHGRVKEGSETSDAEIRNTSEQVICVYSLVLDKKDQLTFKVLSDQKITKFKEVDFSKDIRRFKPQIRHELPNRSWLKLLKTSRYVLPGFIFFISVALYFCLLFIRYEVIPLTLLLFIITIIYIYIVLHKLVNIVISRITRQ